MLPEKVQAEHEDNSLSPFPAFPSNNCDSEAGYHWIAALFHACGLTTNNKELLALLPITPPLDAPKY